MDLFPLTFAVFFQSIISPHMSVNKQMAKDALFAGRLNIEKSDLEYIAPGTFSDYIKGNRPVRTTTINQICNMKAEELVLHIELLGLQDIPSVLMTIKKLLHIVDISEQLRSELLLEADQTKRLESYLANIFQLSLKCSNTKRKLSDEDIIFLIKISESNFDSYEKNYEEKSYSTSQENRQTKKEQSTNNNLKIFNGLRYCWQDVILPDDFDSFKTYVVDNTIISFEDIEQICKCNSVIIKILEVSYFKDIHKYDYQKIFYKENLDYCEWCHISISGDITLSQAHDYTDIIKEIVGNDTDIIFTAQYNEEIKDHVETKAIFYINNDNNHNFKNDLKKSSLDSEILHNNREIQIPKFMEPKKTFDWFNQYPDD